MRMDRHGRLSERPGKKKARPAWPRPLRHKVKYLVVIGVVVKGTHCSRSDPALGWHPEDPGQYGPERGGLKGHRQVIFVTGEAGIGD
jgi:hypothetical protein